MFDPLWDFLQKQLAENNFFSGGLILMLAGGAVAYFREVPSRAWSWLKSRFVIEVDILDRDPAFDWLDEWLARHPYAQTKARWLSVRTKAVDYRDRQGNPTGDHRPRIIFTPAPGEHWLFYRGRFVVLNRVRPEMNQQSAQPVNVRETFHLQVFTRDRRLVQQLLEDARDAALPPGDCRLTVYRNSYTSWSESLQRFPRPPESVVLRAGVMEGLIADCRKFLEQRRWYIERGIPYRRGLLLWGPPGTGKSSAVVAVASALKMDIAILNLGGSALDDNDLAELLAELPANAILLIEDIDCVFVQRKGTDDKTNRVSFSGLLNALDGVAAGEGRILFATTNHRERLDPALIRPGRVDQQIEIGLAEREQIERMFLRFFPAAGEEVVRYFGETVPARRLTMSSLQTFLIEHAGNADEALLHLDDWLAKELSAPWRAMPSSEPDPSAPQPPTLGGSTDLGDDARYCVGL